MIPGHELRKPNGGFLDRMLNGQYPTKNAT